MNKFFLTLLVAATPFVAFGEPRLLSEKEAVAEVHQVCKQTKCMILTERQVQQLGMEIGMIAEQAYVMGAQEGLEAAKNNPKICPRNT